MATVATTGCRFPGAASTVFLEEFLSRAVEPVKIVEGSGRYQALGAREARRVGAQPRDAGAEAAPKRSS